MYDQHTQDTHLEPFHLWYIVATYEKVGMVWNEELLPYMSVEAEEEIREDLPPWTETPLISTAERCVLLLGKYAGVGALAG